MGGIARKSAVALEALATEINEEHRRCEESLKAGLRHALRAGELLNEAKSQVKHGGWGAWLEENFEGSERTAQAYMKVHRDRKQLEEANPQRVADLSYRGALKELAAPRASSDGGDIDSLSQGEMAQIIRSMLETPLFSGRGDELEGEAVEARLTNAGERERKLLKDLSMEIIRLYGAQVQVDGYLLEPAENYPPMPDEMHDDASRQSGLVMSYRSPDLKKLYAVPVPVRNPERHAERIRRGSEVEALCLFKIWRLLANWRTEVVGVQSEKDLDTIKANAEWRRAEPAAHYLHDELYGRDTLLLRAAESGATVREFREMVEGVQGWIRLQAFYVRRGIAPGLKEGAA